MLPMVAKLSTDFTGKRVHNAPRAYNKVNRLGLQLDMDNIHLHNNKQPLLSTYISYRVGLGLLLTIIFSSELTNDFLHAHYPELFLNTSYAYLAISLLTLCLNLAQQIRLNTFHILLILVPDFIAICLMIYSSHNASAGLSYLLLISMAVGSTFLRGKTSVALAAFASLFLIVLSLLSEWQGISNSSSTLTAGITGILLFATAISFRLFSRKIQSDEYKIQQQIEQTDYIQRISEQIIETVQSGIIIIDKQLSILFINQAAEKLLSKEKPLRDINHILPLYELLTGWQNNPEKLSKDNIIRLGLNDYLRVHCTPIIAPYNVSLMLYIQDEKRVIQEAQQLKLASLGRLTASIAHEIRNPLTAISHASQLLEESTTMATSDRDLLKMIHNNTHRINTTISAILDFSSRKKAQMQTLCLNEWLQQFTTQYHLNSGHVVHLNVPSQNIYCHIDSNHLHQIISNLVDNGFNHSKVVKKENIVTIEIGLLAKNAQPYINVFDEGEGVDEKNVSLIFEPFYTTTPTGSGLGLYLCKELCQANQADLVYLPKTAQQKSGFRLLLLAK